MFLSLNSSSGGHVPFCQQLKKSYPVRFSVVNTHACWHLLIAYPYSDRLEYHYLSCFVAFPLPRQELDLCTVSGNCQPEEEENDTEGVTVMVDKWVN